MYILSEQTVDEQVPQFHILNLVHEQIGKIAVNPIKRLKQLVKVGGLQVGQTVVVKVDIGWNDFSVGKVFQA